MLYIVLVWDDYKWTTVVETYDEKEAVVTQRRLQKQGKQAIIDYEETK